MIPAPDLFTARLRPGERILWSGAPAQGLRLRAADAFLIPFSLMWGGFAVVWEGAALAGALAGMHAAGAVGGFALLFPLWGVPFVLVGLYLMVGRFFVDAWMRAGVSYALTDRRALIVRRRGGSAFQSAPLTDDLRLSRLSAEGRGTIGFGPQVPWFGGGYGRSFGLWAPAMSVEPEFFQIAGASAAFDLALRQAHSA